MNSYHTSTNKLINQENHNIHIAYITT